jgi:hypothetical protein
MQMHFYIRDPNPTHTKSDLGVGFIFHPWMHLKKNPENRKKSEKNSKPKRNLKKTPKKLKTQKNPERNHLQNLT